MRGVSPLFRASACAERVIFTGASHAQRAADFLHQLQEPQAASEAALS